VALSRGLPSPSLRAAERTWCGDGVPSASTYYLAFIFSLTPDLCMQHERLHTGCLESATVRVGRRQHPVPPSRVVSTYQLLVSRDNTQFWHSKVRPPVPGLFVSLLGSVFACAGGPSTLSSSMFLHVRRSLHHSCLHLSLAGQAVLTLPSALSFASISAPLAHMLTRTEIAHPTGGPMPEQARVLASHASLALGSLPAFSDVVGTPARHARGGSGSSDGSRRLSGESSRSPLTSPAVDGTADGAHPMLALELTLSIPCLPSRSPAPGAAQPSVWRAAGEGGDGPRPVSAASSSFSFATALETAGASRASFGGAHEDEDEGKLGELGELAPRTPHGSRPATPTLTRGKSAHRVPAPVCIIDVVIA
jgi:hypothetical protein